MSIILGALGGLGEAMQNVSSFNLKSDMDKEREIALARERDTLETNRAQTLETFRQRLKDAPLDRLSIIARQRANEQVPVEAEKITHLKGDINPSPLSGFVGNYKDVLAEVSAMKDGPDKQAALAQLNKQLSDEQARADAAVAGQTRPRTSEESMRAALDYARINDPVAYAEYEARIGKPMRDERRVDNQERKIDIQQEFNEARAKYQDRLAEIAEERAKRQEDRQGDQMDKAETQSTRQALISVLKDIGAQEDKIQVKMMDAMLNPEQKAVLESQFKTLDRDRVQTRNELLKLAGIEPKIEEQKKPTNTWDSTTGEVVSNGQIIGKATSPAEAKALIARSKTKAESTQQETEATKRTQSNQPSTNEAGYYDVQGTIDGAKRGDKKALAYLQTLIERGETTPAQRQQIAKLTSSLP